MQRMGPLVEGNTLALQRHYPVWSLGQMALEVGRVWPLAQAIVDARQHISYAELSYLVQSWARHMILLGVRSEDRVAVVAHKRIESIIAMLAANAAGAAFVPLDPNAGDQRQAQLLEDAAPSLVVGLGESPSLPARAWLDLGQLRKPAPPSLWLPLPSTASDSVSYVLYTSGSTGRPKGVEITHAGLLAFFEAHNQRVGIGVGHRCLNTSPFHFDVLLMDVMLPLYCGATVFLTPELPIPTLLLRAIEEKRITHMYATGTVLGLITGDGSRLKDYDLSSLQVLQTGAEACNVRMVNEWLRRYPSLGFLNSYGPTEVTVGCVSYRKPAIGPLPGNECPIGYLHDGCGALIVSESGRPIRTRPAFGELWLTGAQVMRGYHNRPEEQSYSIVEYESARYYRTGDLVRCDANGLLWFVGRIDDEVKIAGHRIHLNEVQLALAQHPSVLQLAVGVVQSQSGNVIGAAVESRGGASRRTAKSLLEWAHRTLPAPVVPQLLLFASELPRTANGKVDRGRCMRLLAGAERGSGGRVFALQAGELTALEK